MALTDAFKLSMYAQLDSCVCEETNFKVLSAPCGEKKPFKRIIEPHLGIIEPLLGITKPAEGINKPCLGDFVISSAASEAKTSMRLYARICLRTINLLNSYYLKIIFSEPSLDIRTSSFVYNYYLRKKSSLIPFCALDIYI